MCNYKYKLLSVILLCGLVFSCMHLSGAENANEMLARLIEDEGFRECVRNETDIAEEDSPEEVLRKLESCESLFFIQGVTYDMPIRSLESLSLLPNLKQLMIGFDGGDDSAIVDLTPITQLSRLECLHFSGADKQNDYSFLGEMHTITELSLRQCEIEDVSFLEQMPQLQDLEMWDCGIEDISFLNGLTQLRSVNLNGNSVTELSPLAGLDKLECVRLSENGVKDISALANLARLNSVELSDNQIEDLSPLAGKEDLMYVSISGNPVKSMEPVWEVPLLLYTDKGVSQEEEAFMAAWLAGHHPEAAEFTGIDYIQGDLNDDGLQDIAFVVCSPAFDADEGEDFPEWEPDKSRMFILLRQNDGTWKEQENVPQLDADESAGLYGEPYRGAFMQAGYLLIWERWGDGSDSVKTDRYEYRDGNFCLTKQISVEDYDHAVGYDVEIRDEPDGTWQRYALATDGLRWMRVDLADSEHLIHKAFPGISIYDNPHYLYDMKAEPRLTSEEALDRVCESLVEDGDSAVLEELPYAGWQKEGYERLLCVTLPDYYYVLSRPEGETWEGDYLYYNGVVWRNERYSHVICLRREQETKKFLLDDVTGEIIEE